MTHAHAQFIYRRTHSGQNEALISREKLSHVERGLLLSVNGYTPLSVLMQLRRDGEAALAAVARLLDLNLVEAVRDEPQSEADMDADGLDRQPHAA